ncbi:MAG: VOC family protein [Actinomycetota bacterium]|nr:VOC family protein [Actinomycetota bacterium]
MPIHYVSLKVSDLERSASFYDSVLSPLGWRRQEDGSKSISWGLTRSAFFVERDDSQRPGFGQVSFPARSIPAVKASFESGVANGGDPAAEPGSAPLHGPGNYAARMVDPDGYIVEFVVAHD